MNLKPLGDRVVIKPRKAEEKTKGGIFLPETATKEKPLLGTVVAVGAGKLFASLDNTSNPRITNTDSVQYSNNRLWTTDDLIKPEGFAT